MTDRVPLYPGRVRLSPVSGQTNTYDMVMADQPQINGTPLNKNTFLNDDTASAFGLVGDPTVNDVFSWLAKFNTYCWARRQVNVEETKTNIASNVSISIGTSGLDAQYASSVDSNGNLVNPSTLHLTRSASSASDMVSHAPCYYLLNGIIYFIPSNATSGSTSSTVYYNSTSRTLILESGATVKAQTVAITVTVVGDWESVFSTNRNAYPDSGVSGSYEYRFSGVPYDELTRAPIIAYGSYVGTGTYGVANPNTIELDFVPRLLIVKSGAESGTIRGNMPWMYGSTSGISTVYFASDLIVVYVDITWGKTVSWYETNSAERQLNVSGRTYNWIAIC